MLNKCFLTESFKSSKKKFLCKIARLGFFQICILFGLYYLKHLLSKFLWISSSYRNNRFTLQPKILFELVIKNESTPRLEECRDLWYCPVLLHFYTSSSYDILVHLLYWWKNLLFIILSFSHFEFINYSKFDWKQLMLILDMFLRLIFRNEIKEDFLPCYWSQSPA